MLQDYQKSYLHESQFGLLWFILQGRRKNIHSKHDTRSETHYGTSSKSTLLLIMHPGANRKLSLSLVLSLIITIV